MTYWMRSSNIQIENSLYTMDNGFYYDFSVTFFDSEELPNATIKIHNFNSTTRSNIKKNDALILNAGYESDTGCIFTGRINAVKNEKSGTEWITEITATSALDNWLNSRVNKTYMPGVDAFSIGMDLLNMFGAEVGRYELAQNRTYDRGKVCSGKLKDIMKQIFVEENKSRLVIRNNQISVSDPGAGKFEGYYLTAQSGLLEDRGGNEEIEIGEDNAKGESETGEIQLKCLLNYHIGPGDYVQVQSRKHSGVYRVVSGTHKGSPGGEWVTELKLRAV